MEDCLFENPGPWVDVRMVVNGARRSLQLSTSDLGMLGSTDQPRSARFGSNVSATSAGGGSSVGAGTRRSSSGRFKRKVRLEMFDLKLLATITITITITGRRGEGSSNHESAKSGMFIF